MGFHARHPGYQTHVTLLYSPQRVNSFLHGKKMRLAYAHRALTKPNTGYNEKASCYFCLLLQCAKKTSSISLLFTETVIFTHMCSLLNPAITEKIIKNRQPIDKLVVTTAGKSLMLLIAYANYIARKNYTSMYQALRPFTQPRHTPLARMHTHVRTHTQKGLAAPEQALVKVYVALKPLLAIQHITRK